MGGSLLVLKIELQVYVQNLINVVQLLLTAVHIILFTKKVFHSKKKTQNLFSSYFFSKKMFESRFSRYNCA